MFSRINARGIAAVLFAIAGIAGVGTITGVAASPPAQTGVLSITDRAPLSGGLGAATPQTTYQFDCTAGGVASVRVETTSGDLETAITVMDASGGILAQGGRVSAAPNVAVAEAFEMPANERCQVTLARVGDTSGQYAVRLLPGYATLAKYDTFDNPEDPLQMVWEPYASESMTVATIGQRLQIQVFTDNLLGYAIPSGDDVQWGDFYAQAEYEIAGDPSYAEYGFVIRLHDEEELFYALTFSSDGDWSVYWFDGEWNEIQAWTQSDVVDGFDRTPTVGVLVDGYTFRAYFNGQFVGEATDVNRYTAEGTVALVGATGVDQADPLMVFIDNVIVTTPAQLPASGLPFSDDGDTPTATPSGLLGLLSATKTPAPAQPTPTPPVSTAMQLTSWDSGSPKQIVAELTALGLVPSGGSVALSVPSSYGDTSASGFSFYPLGQGRTFRNFVLAFDARLINTGPESGCGMYFRDSNTLNSDALVFEDGSFLLGEWDAAGSLLDSSIIEFNTAVIPGRGATNGVIVVAVEGDVTMFVNGTRVASTVFTPVAGGLALEVYVAEDDAGATVQTYCQLNDIWLWEF